MTPLDTALAALAERLCTAAGTDLHTATRDLLGKHHDDRTPAALRAGWSVPDTTIPTPPSEESA